MITNSKSKVEGYEMRKSKWRIDVEEFDLTGICIYVSSKSQIRISKSEGYVKYR